MLISLSAAFGLFLAGSAPIQGSAAPVEPDTTIDARTRQEVIEGVLRRIREDYVYPQTAARMEQAVRQRAQRGEYNSIVSANAFASRLTRDLRAVSRDLHLEVVYSAKGVSDEPPGGEPSPEERRKHAEYGRRINWGLVRAERLDGNVGYLEIRSFDFEAPLPDSALAAAMNFLGNTDALILDVRRNGGGEPSYVALVCSYLMSPGTLINKFYWRPLNRWDEFRTGKVSGRYYGKTKPVYVLTGGDTFSGAEEFAYDIQTQKRGEVLGDTTGGGAHPGGMRRVGEHFGVWVPAGRAVNPVTGKNWERTGVVPDVPVSAEEALRTAHRRALDRVLGAERDPVRKEQLKRVIQEVGKS